jgi:flavin-dependent thymidylate synthase
MKVTLLEYTKDADKLLIFSKKTRLNMTPSAYDEIKQMSQEQVDKELGYVFGTIGSSWEFVDYTFLVTDVSRAFTHQFVRHRHASYAQQSMRTVDVSDSFDYISTGACDHDPIIKELYSNGMEDIRKCYSGMISKGAKVEDARGILPTNITTNIMAKFNLRSMSDLIADRLCVRAQGEFQQVAKEMKNEIIKVHPWAEKILKIGCVKTGYCKFSNFKDCPMKKEGLIKEVDSDMLEKRWKELL